MHLQARATVGVDESLQAERDAEAPAGAELPRVLGWLGPDQTTVDAGVLPVDRRIGQVWRVAVAPAPDTVTTVSFNLEAVP